MGFFNDMEISKYEEQELILRLAFGSKALKMDLLIKQ